jgi:hypothetical protein
MRGTANTIAVGEAEAAGPLEVGGQSVRVGVQSIVISTNDRCSETISFLNDCLTLASFSLILTYKE